MKRWRRLLCRLFGHVDERHGVQEDGLVTAFIRCERCGRVDADSFTQARRNRADRRRAAPVVKGALRRSLRRQTQRGRRT